MADDVGVTTASEGVEDTTVVQGYMGISRYQTFESTTVEILTLGHVFAVARGAACHTGETTVQIDIGAIFRVILVSQIMNRRVVRIWLVTDGIADSALLTTTENLEGVALVQVDGRTTPDLRVTTIAATEDIQGQAEAIRTLLRENHTRIALRDGIIIILFLCGICILVVDVSLIGDVKEPVAFMNRGIQVDDHITFHVTIAIATTVDISALKTTIKVGSIALTRA